MGRMVMFMMFVWLMVTIAGNVVSGQMDIARTNLTVALADDTTTITVTDTGGFPDAGILDIEGERVAYSGKTPTTLVGSTVRPLIRGTSGTDAVAHSAGVIVSTVPGALINSGAAYNIAVMADPSGLLAFISLPLAFFSLLGNFLFLPLQFLGTDLQILTYFWAVIGVGVLVSFTVAMAGGRRV